MNICIYGSASKSQNLNPVYIEACRKLGKTIGEKGHGLIFGGCCKGLIGVTAEAVAEESGEILGIAPRFYDLEDEIYSGCTDFIYTDTMSERKDLFRINADAFVMLPGGIGTFDEFFETIEYKSIGQHEKPVVLFNIDGYFDQLDAVIQYAMEQHFVQEQEHSLYHMASSVEEVIEWIEKKE